MNLASWIHFSARGWWVWAGVVAVFCAYLLWIRTTRVQRTFVPLVFVALWLAGSLAYYIATHWHHYFHAGLIWWTGLASILAIAPVPLAVSLIVERATSPVISPHALRLAVAACLGVLVTLFVQLPLALWAQRVAAHALQ